jgi:hypothetical protein
MASMIRRQTAAPIVVLLSEKLIGAFLERFLAVALERHLASSSLMDW